MPQSLVLAKDVTCGEEEAELGSCLPLTLEVRISAVAVPVKWFLFVP